MAKEEKFKENKSSSHKEGSEKEELEFLKREEIKTMQKDLAELRELEAQKEREKVSGFKPQKDIAEDKGGAEEKIKKEEKAKKKEEILIPKPPKKPSSSQKMLIRGAIIIILILVIAFFYWFFIIEKMKLPIEEIILPPEEKLKEEVTKEETPSTEEELFLSPENEQETKEDMLLNAEEELIINQRIVSWGFHIPTTSRTIDTIIVHSTYDASSDNPYSIEGVIEQFQTYEVTSHYLIDREGTIYQLAPDDAIAYHTGEGIMPDKSRKNVINDFSLGIELIYEETESPHEVQYQSLAQLINYLRENYSIPTQNILGHSQIAPERKTDPWNFDWQKLNQLI